MKKTLRVITKLLAGFLLLFGLYILIVLIHGTFTDYQPEPVIELEPGQSSDISTITDSVLSFTIWNLGYGGLGEESDFFYDSGSQLLARGKMIRTPDDLVDKNVKGFMDFVGQIKSDFFLFQEVDYASKRSYFINQFEKISKELPGFAAFFAPNYRVSRVPIPIMEPWRVYGRTLSGLATYSRFQPAESHRIQLPGNFSWPTSVFGLDRCLAVHRYPVDNGKELIVYNLHHSAYDVNGGLKRQQMDFLRERMLADYEKGHYVVAGGDWNLCPPNFRFDSFMPGLSNGYTQINIDPEFLPADWTWVYDPTIPTNRKTKSAYKKGETFITVIDFFLISPNLRVLSVKGLDQGFRFSDHQPVWMEVELQNF